MTKDAGKLPQSLSREQLAALEKIGPSREQLAALKTARTPPPPGLQEALAQALPPERWSRDTIEFVQRRLVRELQAVEDLEHKRDALEREIAERRKAIASMERALTRAGWGPAREPPPPIPAETKPADETGPDPPTLVEQARGALRDCYPPNGQPPPGMKRDAILFEINARLKKDADERGAPSPAEIKRDTLLRALKLKR